MTHLTQTRTGVDVLIGVIPDTPKNWDLVQEAVSVLDRFASQLHAIGTDWTVDASVIADGHLITITAEPATEQDTAA